MQIGSFNPLTYLPGSGAATGKADDAEKRASAQAAAGNAASNATDTTAATEVTPEPRNGLPCRHVLRAHRLMLIKEFGQRTAQLQAG